MDEVTEYGVRLPNGSIEQVYYDADTATVMSHEEYASVRARTLGGVVVTRTSRVQKSEWTPQPTKHQLIASELRDEIRTVRNLADEMEYRGAQKLADLAESLLESETM